VPVNFLKAKESCIVRKMGGKKSGYSQVFYDATRLNAVSEVNSQKDASRNGVPGPFSLASV
jgi:hypothetical protein